MRGGASLKEICHGSLLEEVEEGYSACLEELVRFRTDHLVLVDPVYIVLMVSNLWI